MTTLKPSAEDDGKAQYCHLYNHKPLCEWRQITSTPVQPLEKEATDTLKVLSEDETTEATTNKQRTSNGQTH